MIFWLSRQLFRRPNDNREPYVRTEKGQALALLVSGPELTYLDIVTIFDTPNHEEYIHDGTLHQNPSVVERTGAWWNPFAGRKQDRYYPLTIGVDGRLPDLNAIEAQARAYRLRRGQRVEIVPMPPEIERKAAIGENATQLARGVPRSRLTHNRRGRRKGGRQ